MKSKNKQDKFDGKVTSWTQKLGVAFIGILTILGSVLIIYTGVMAATYEGPKTENQFLTYEETNELITEDSTVSEYSNELEQTSSATDSSNEQLDFVENKKPQMNSNEAYCNIDGVNVRAEAATGTDIIGNLDEGDLVQVLDRYYSEGWVQISFEGQTGYVYVEYLTFES